MSGGTRELIAAAQRGESASMERLVEENAPLIWSVVRRFMGRGTDAEDLFQLGSIGFIKAVRGFDEGFGTQFSTYAVPKIAGEIRRYLRDDGMIKVSRSVKENAVRLRAARESFEKTHGRSPHISELTELTGLSAEEITLCEQAASDTLSLDTPPDAGAQPLAEVLRGDGGEDRLVESLALSGAIERLEPVQKAVIILRYFRDLTQQKTAQILDISQVQVSRLEKRACAALRQSLGED